jgi:hypothetical protein
MSAYSSEGVESEQVYIDVAFVRIQRYLARTPQLRTRRASSAGMKAATDSEMVANRVLAGLAVANEQAGIADGVVNLCLSDPQYEGREDRVRQVVNTVFAYLRAEFPAAEFQAVSGTGESYLAAYVEEIAPKTERGEVFIALPALPEFPAVRSCALCRTDPGTEWEKFVTRNRGDETELVCADCSRRLHRHGEPNIESTAQRVQTQLELDDAPDMLEDLAPLGPAGIKRNHLATIYIDGNSVGQFFRDVVHVAADRPELQGVKRELSKNLANCTETALCWATSAVAEAIEPGYNKMMPVVPHVLGGDDVLVSVPAGYAWPFVVRFLETFDAEASDLVMNLDSKYGLKVIAPSASAGMVFARHSEPMYLLVDLVEERLRAAKTATAGRASSVDFLDLTTEGAQGTGDPPLALAHLTTPTTRDALDRLARLSGSLQTQLGQALRDHADELSAEAQARRLNVFQTVQPFLANQATGVTPSGLTLRAALRIAQWWRPGTVKLWSEE